MKISFLNTPKFLAFPIFGLSISQGFIRIAKLQKKDKNFIPELVSEVVLHETCDVLKESDMCPQVETLKKYIIDLKKKHNIKFVNLSIPEEHTYVFKATIPKEAIVFIDDFIINNVDQYIPLSASEIYFDYKILKSHIEEDQVPIVVTAIPKTIVERYTSLLDSCGIFVIGCEPETHAIARAVIDKKDKNPYIILNIHEYSTNISVVEDGLVQYTQTASITSNDVLENISDSVANLLKDTVNKVIIYWFTSKDKEIPHIKIQHIILTGAGSGSLNLINFFESNLPVSVSCAQVWRNCFNIEEYVPTISQKDSLKYATCIGLSLFKLK